MHRPGTRTTCPSFTTFYPWKFHRRLNICLELIWFRSVFSALDTAFLLLHPWVFLTPVMSPPSERATLPNPILLLLCMFSTATGSTLGSFWDPVGLHMRIKFLMEKISTKDQESGGRNTFIFIRNSNAYKPVETVKCNTQETRNLGGGDLEKKS